MMLFSTHRVACRTMSHQVKSWSALRLLKSAPSGAQSQYSRSWEISPNESGLWRKDWMKLRNQPRSERPHWSIDERHQAIRFWIFWTIFVCLALLAIVSLLTDWPPFLHEPPQYFR